MRDHQDAVARGDAHLHEASASNGEYATPVNDEQSLLGRLAFRVLAEQLDVLPAWTTRRPGWGRADGVTSTLLFSRAG